MVGSGRIRDRDLVHLPVDRSRTARERLAVLVTGPLDILRAVVMGGNTHGRNKTVAYHGALVGAGFDGHVANRIAKSLAYSGIPTWAADQLIEDIAARSNRLDPVEHGMLPQVAPPGPAFGGLSLENLGLAANSVFEHDMRRQDTGMPDFLPLLQRHLGRA
jgi:hypothetical protein